MTVGQLGASVVRLILLALACYSAFQIRLYAVNTYGRVIHEFDPYFNLRSTEYLVDHGWTAFFNWYDERSWYPLGRPVGTTIYPGLQITSWATYHVGQALGQKWSVNDICVFTPAFFSVITCIFIYLLTVEASKSANAGVVAAAIMAIIPSHIMRSVAGGYDNESIAIAALCGTFYFWMRSLRDKNSWKFGFLTAVAYIYMVAAWGGYTFVLNCIGLHAIALCFLNRHDTNLHRAYTIFYVIGTMGAMRVPVVGQAPLRSLEQLGPMFVFFVVQVLEFMAMHRRAYPDEPLRKYREWQAKVISVLVLATSIAIAVLYPRGYFGPVSARIRGLFVQHTKTGNPLVDSVAEHQATQDSMYQQYFHAMYTLAPIGLVSLLWRRSNAKYFVLVYSLAAYYFSKKMVRLILLLSPASSILGGMAVAGLLEWSVTQLLMFFKIDLNLGSNLVAGLEIKPFVKEVSEEPTSTSTSTTSNATASVEKKAKKDKKVSSNSVSIDSVEDATGFVENAFRKSYDFSVTKIIRVLAAPVIIYMMSTTALDFWVTSQRTAEQMSSPSIMFAARYRDGREVMIDDFREAYWWVRDNTPEDSRVLSWWDYGYQIAQIANRTTLADGNTCSHEHIALIGKTLVSDVPSAHKIARHLADYVLVWSTRYGGMMGDDIAKSPHMARISHSVYKDVKVQDFWMDQRGNPSPMMKKSLIYTLVNYRLSRDVPSIPTDSKGNQLFTEVYTSKNNMVRIYAVERVSKASKDYGKLNLGYKAWLDGVPLKSVYPPALEKILETGQDYAQLEDFNAKTNKKPVKYD